MHPIFIEYKYESNTDLKLSCSLVIIEWQEERRKSVCYCVVIFWEGTVTLTAGKQHFSMMISEERIYW
jgi:hypothetical protein